MATQVDPRLGQFQKRSGPNFVSYHLLLSKQISVLIQHQLEHIRSCLSLIVASRNYHTTHLNTFFLFDFFLHILKVKSKGLLDGLIPQVSHQIIIVSKLKKKFEKIYKLMKKGFRPNDRRLSSFRFGTARFTLFSFCFSWVI